jgi:replication factor A1
MAGTDIDKPVFQILGVRRIGPNANEASERYRMLVSDGKLFHSFAMLATQLNEIYTSGQLPDFTIVQVNRYITSMLNQNTPKEKYVFVCMASS